MSDVRLGADTSDTAEGGRRPPAYVSVHREVVHAHHVDRAAVPRAGLEDQGSALRHPEGGGGDAHRQLGALQAQQLAPAAAAAVGPHEHLAPAAAEGLDDAEVAEHRVVGEQGPLHAPLVGPGDGRAGGAGGGHALAGRAPPGERREDAVGEGYGVGGQRVGMSRWAVQSAPGPGRRRAHPPRPARRSPRRAIATEAR